MVCTLVKAGESTKVPMRFNEPLYNYSIVYTGRITIKKKSHEDYVSELAEKNPNVIVLEKYVDANTGIKHKCLIHNVEWVTTPSRALAGKGCHVCHSERITKSKIRTDDWYTRSVSEHAPHIIPLEPYIDCRTPIEHFCTKHNIRWKSLPDNILHGHWCRECGNEKIRDRLTMPYDDYTYRLQQLNPNIICIGKYTCATSHVLHKCLIDGYEWMAVPSQILNGRGCPKCANQVKRTQEAFVEDIHRINPDIEVLGEYVSAKTKVAYRCMVCGNIWEAMPESTLAGCGCPVCKESHGERQIRQWLMDRHIPFVSQHKFKDCKNIRELPFDFYLPDNNLVIEYDGEQHYRPVDYFGGQDAFERLVKRDRMKTKYCNEHSIGLLRIPYYKDVQTELNNYISA